MNITIRYFFKVEREMEYQINEVLETFRAKITEDISPSAARQLLLINKNEMELLNDKAEIF